MHCDPPYAPTPPDFSPRPSPAAGRTTPAKSPQKRGGRFPAPPPPSRPSTTSAEWRSSPGSSCVAAEHWQPVRPPACRLRQLTGAQSIAVIFVPDSDCLEPELFLTGKHLRESFHTQAAHSAHWPVDSTASSTLYSRAAAAGAQVEAQAAHQAEMGRRGGGGGGGNHTHARTHARREGGFASWLRACAAPPPPPPGPGGGGGTGVL